MKKLFIISLSLVSIFCLSNAMDSGEGKTPVAQQNEPLPSQQNSQNAVNKWKIKIPGHGEGNICGIGEQDFKDEFENIP